MMQLAPNQVVIDWGDGRVVILSVQVTRLDWRSDAPERRLEELIAETLWASWHVSALAPAGAAPAE